MMYSRKLALVWIMGSLVTNFAMAEMTWFIRPKKIPFKVKCTSESKTKVFELCKGTGKELRADGLNHYPGVFCLPDEKGGCYEENADKCAYDDFPPVVLADKDEDTGQKDGAHPTECSQNWMSDSAPPDVVPIPVQCTRHDELVNVPWLSGISKWCKEKKSSGVEERSNVPVACFAPGKFVIDPKTNKPTNKKMTPEDCRKKNGNPLVLSDEVVRQRAEKEALAAAAAAAAAKNSGQPATGKRHDKRP